MASFSSVCTVILLWPVNSIAAGGLSRPQEAPFDSYWPARRRRLAYTRNGGEMLKTKFGGDSDLLGSEHGSAKPERIY